MKKHQLVMASLLLTFTSCYEKIEPPVTTAEAEKAEYLALSKDINSELVTNEFDSGIFFETAHWINNQAFVLKGDVGKNSITASYLDKRIPQLENLVSAAEKNDFALVSKLQVTEAEELRETIFAILYGIKPKSNDRFALAIADASNSDVINYFEVVLSKMITERDKSYFNESIDMFFDAQQVNYQILLHFATNELPKDRKSYASSLKSQLELLTKVKANIDSGAGVAGMELRAMPAIIAKWEAQGLGQKGTNDAQESTSRSGSIVASRDAKGFRVLQLATASLALTDRGAKSGKVIGASGAEESPLEAAPVAAAKPPTAVKPIKLDADGADDEDAADEAPTASASAAAAAKAKAQAIAAAGARANLNRPGQPSSAESAAAAEAKPKRSKFMRVLLAAGLTLGFIGILGMAVAGIVATIGLGPLGILGALIFGGAGLAVIPIGATLIHNVYTGKTIENERVGKLQSDYQPPDVFNDTNTR